MSSFLLVGPPGSGKTTALATAAKLGPIAVLDFDNKMHKMENIKPWLRTKENPKGNLIQIPINSPLSTIGLRRLATTKTEQGGSEASTRPEGYLNFVDAITKIEKDGYCWEGTKLFGIGLDSYSSMQEHLKRLLLASNSKMTMTLPLYGTLLTNLEEINNTFVRMPIHTFILAHEKLDKDELTGKITCAILVEGSMAGKIGKDFEEIYYLTKTISGLGDKAKAEYKMMTVGDSIRSARTSRVLPALVDPDFSKILG